MEPDITMMTAASNAELEREIAIPAREEEEERTPAGHCGKRKRLHSAWAAQWFYPTPS